MSNGNNGNVFPQAGSGNDGNGYPVTKTVTSPLSEKNVFDACVKLKSTGMPISTRNVYQLLHRGSFRDIQKYVNHFKELELKEQLQTLEQDNRFSDTVKILAEMLAENAVKQRIDADEKDKSGKDARESAAVELPCGLLFFHRYEKEGGYDYEQRDRHT